MALYSLIIYFIFTTLVLGTDTAVDFGQSVLVFVYLGIFDEWE